MYVTDSNYAVSSWMSLTISARDAASSSVTDLDRAGQAIVEIRSFSLSDIVSAVRDLFSGATRRPAAVTGLFDRDLTDLGLVRLQLASTDERVDDARWTAYDPRLPQVANSNNRGRSRVA